MAVLGVTMHFFLRKNCLIVVFLFWLQENDDPPGGVVGCWSLILSKMMLPPMFFITFPIYALSCFALRFVQVSSFSTPLR